MDSQTFKGFTPLHRCAFYDHSRLASLLCLAGASRLKDSNGDSAYDVAVARGNTQLISILKPLIDSAGNDITGIQYATNNPKHPNFRPNARTSLFAMFDLESSMA